MPRLARLPKRPRTVMEVPMNEDMQSAERDNLMSRLWRTMIMWDEAISTDPLELLEKRVAALEHEGHQAKEFRSRSCKPVRCADRAGAGSPGADASQRCNSRRR